MNQEIKELKTILKEHNKQDRLKYDDLIQKISKEINLKEQKDHISNQNQINQKFDEINK